MEGPLGKLHRAIELAEEEADVTTLTSARLVSGEVLAELGRTSEARAVLTLVANFAPDPSLDDVLDWEIGRARELLARLTET